MAIKNQCLKCKFYNNLTDICTKLYCTPTYNGHFCEDYSRIGGNINLNKGNSINLEKVKETIISEPTPTQSPYSYAPQLTPSPTNEQNQGEVPPASNHKMFKSPFSFKGRIRRLEYGLTYLIGIFYVYFYVELVELSISDKEVLILFLLLILDYWFLFAQGAKRCHDLGHSGWWQIIPFYELWMIFKDGEGTNEYGPSPKY